MKKKLFIIGIISMMALVLVGCGNKEDEKKDVKKVYGFNEKFEYDGLEITIGDNYSFEVIQSEYSDLNGETMVKIPITVKNIKEETNSLVSSTVSSFGSKGTEVDWITGYADDDVVTAGDLRAGASYDKYIYLLYDGDGKYALEFDQDITVEFQIKK